MPNAFVSIGKAFTRAAAMDLAKANRLALSDTVAKHLPAIKIPSADRITIQQLLFSCAGDETVAERLRKRVSR